MREQPHALQIHPPTSAERQQQRPAAHEDAATVVRRTSSLIARRASTCCPAPVISTDMIAGLLWRDGRGAPRRAWSSCSQVQYDQAFMFHYSQRDKTHAHRTMPDDVPESCQTAPPPRHHRHLPGRRPSSATPQLLGSVQLVLIEGRARRSPDDWTGRTDGNRIAVLPQGPLGRYGGLAAGGGGGGVREVGVGDYVAVEVLRCTSMSFVCRALGWTTQAEFYALHPDAATVRRVELLAGYRRGEARLMGQASSEEVVGQRMEAGAGM